MVENLKPCCLVIRWTRFHALSAVNMTSLLLCLPTGHNLLLKGTDCAGTISA